MAVNRYRPEGLPTVDECRRYSRPKQTHKYGDRLLARALSKHPGWIMRCAAREAAR